MKLMNNNRLDLAKMSTVNLENKEETEVNLEIDKLSSSLVKSGAKKKKEIEKSVNNYTNINYKDVIKECLIKYIKPEAAEVFLKVIHNVVVELIKKCVDKSLYNEFFTEVAYESMYYLEQGVKIKFLVELYKNNITRYKSAEFKRFFVLDTDKTNITVEESIHPCKKCKQFKTLSYNKQTRSADEGMTTFVYCPGCDLTYKFNN